MTTKIEDRYLLKKTRGVQTKTKHQLKKSMKSGLSHVNGRRLPGWGARDYRNQWLETLNDMDQNRLQWRWCIHFCLPPNSHLLNPSQLFFVFLSPTCILLNRIFEA
ncbi:unnamed protein product [Schistosoma rodhaini]|uniref:Uncharacterized protein n=1 Tax=Schistosoma rodhaini TaxID=6188 RepID=A0AA85FZE2_9TREM|nr:unnamed protein product [Schistosoma rodhaini]